MVDKSITTGENASVDGQTSKASLSQIKDSILADVSTIQGQKGEYGVNGAVVQMVHLLMKFMLQQQLIHLF